VWLLEAKPYFNRVEHAVQAGKYFNPISSKNPELKVFKFVACRGEALS
jgi:hypothetical protein